MAAEAILRLWEEDSMEAALRGTGRSRGWLAKLIQNVAARGPECLLTRDYAARPEPSAE
ncbi:MAG: hypothetical protein M3409_03770 [Gemmatimonadota bacterium]|nr:hypothetical protein [Gemmatimonadota bacterium]